MTAGDSATIDANGGDITDSEHAAGNEVQIVWRNPEGGDSQALNTDEIP